MLKKKGKNQIFRVIPSVDTILKEINTDEVPRRVLVSYIRDSIKKIRLKIPEDILNINFRQDIYEKILMDVKTKISKLIKSKLISVINGTGVVLHTNLGRSVLSKEIIKKLGLILGSYSNLEFDLAKGSRGSRGDAVEKILCGISGAESGFVVNNNAGAVLLCLDTLADKKEVIISRGELVEIGGSFRLPDIILKGGSVLKEVGTTNRTYIEDYKKAINYRTGLILKVHTSNYDILGFTKTVSLAKLVDLARIKSIPLVEDLGSGTFIDFSKYGLKKEPTIQDSLIKGVDIVMFSGDKLLGGPQAGIILGKRKYIDLMRQNPLARALRIGKMALATLEIILQFYWNEKEAVKKIPTLRMLLEDITEIEKRAKILYGNLKEILKQSFLEINLKIFEINSLAGGGSLPLVDFPSKCLGIKIQDVSANEIEKHMRNNIIPIIGRIEKGYFLLDIRTIFYEEIEIIQKAFKQFLFQIEEDRKI